MTEFVRRQIWAARTSISSACVSGRPLAGEYIALNVVFGYALDPEAENG